MALPAWEEVLGLASLFPFSLVPDLSDCIGGLASVTVGPAAWLVGSFCELMTGVWMTLFAAGCVTTLFSPFDISFWPVSLVSVDPSVGTELPEL